MRKKIPRMILNGENPFPIFSPTTDDRLASLIEEKHKFKIHFKAIKE